MHVDIFLFSCLKYTDLYTIYTDLYINCADFYKLQEMTNEIQRITNCHVD